MDFGTLLIFLIIFGLLSFLIEKIWGFSPYKAYLIIGAVTLTISLLFIMWPVMNPPYNLDLSIERLTNWFVNVLPAVLIGDVAGVIIGKITGEEK